MRFKLQLGDVTGAFLEADKLERSNGKLYMSQPHNHHIPGYEADQLFEVIRAIYGLNDSPQQWFVKFNSEAKRTRWVQSHLEPCVFLLWDNSEELQGILGVHVDDVLTGGRGPVYDAALAELKATFPFRKWQEYQGMFCGSWLEQDPETFQITVSQQAFVFKMQRPKLRNRAGENLQVTPEEASSFKSVLGGALWLAKETRPDLSVQVSQGQQQVPHPTLGQARQIGNVVRRAKQYRDQKWVILPMPLTSLRLCLHTDAAFANAKKQGTQAGYLVGVTDDRLSQGLQAPWSPAIWKSYRLKRVLGSTFAGESQVLMDGLGHVEWLGCHLAEVRFKQFSLEQRDSFLQEFKIQAIVDCKSIYDHVQSFASCGSVSD